MIASMLIGIDQTWSSDKHVMGGETPRLVSTTSRINGDKVKGLLLGSAIGDALGGPIEFQKSEAVAAMMPGYRSWSADRALSVDDLSRMSKSLQLQSYQKLRPEPEAYGQWQSSAASGTITDDTRQKMVLMNALQKAMQENRLPVAEKDLARAYLEFIDTEAITKRANYRDLCEESLREYWKSAHWVLGSRDLRIAAPTDRIWAGIPTCCGQMTMLPVAALYAGKPEEAYRACYALSFFDTGTAKDINSAIVAGLAVALQQNTPTDLQSRKTAWQAITNSMKATDPYRYIDVPYASRPITLWLDFSHNAFVRAKGKPNSLFEILENEGQAKYYWEAHFVLALVFSAIEFCDYDPLAAMALVLDFGHDTDSAAQLLGAFVGALHGVQLFPNHLQQPVSKQLAEDYDVSLDDWVELLLLLSDREKYPQVVSFE
ncbi:ADP-ribosylglycohydrolase family protein [Adhaeretor mobilis]|nr:ADP-ribosylglycohydrolase family protein [Adhaeretor mobilis]